MKPIIPMSVFKERREKLLNMIGDAVLLLPAAPECTRNRDCHYAYRQDSDFIYLSNFDEPEAVIVLDGKNKKSILFGRPYDELYVIWEGEIIGQERAKSEYLFDEAYSIEEFDKKLLEYCYNFDTIITPFSRYPDFDQQVLKATKTAKDTRRARAPQEWLNSDKFIHPMRLKKDKYEIAVMQHSGNVSVEAHKAAMAFTQANMNESEVAAVFDYHFSKAGGTAAYGHIVGGGNNACTLHYKVNNCDLKDGDLVLIDAGSEIGSYAADITRTFPINGKFTEPQKRVYDWVLKSMEAAFTACKPGNTIRSPHFAAEDVLIDAVIDLGLVSGTHEGVKAAGTHEKYTIHGTSHWIGIDVHDVGDYKTADGEWLTLEEGMSLTVEPGLYIREDDLDAPEELRGIGVRIEDDIVITKDGYINLTGHAPKTTEDVEKACQAVWKV